MYFYTLKIYIYRLVFSGYTISKRENYLVWAGEREVQEIQLKKRFKCANRSPWYGVPVVNKGDIFFKRYGSLPRIYINQAKVHTTDAGYHIRYRKNLMPKVWFSVFLIP